MSYTPIDDVKSEYGKIMSSELFTLIADNIAYLMDSMPVGSVVPILFGLDGVPAPDPKVWHPCDGSLITNENSPFRQTNAPDYATAGRYIRGFTTAGAIGDYGGANDKDLTHDHGGATQAGGLTGGDTDDDRFSAAAHTHSLASALTTVNFEPEHVRILMYIKIT